MRQPRSSLAGIVGVMLLLGPSEAVEIKPVINVGLLDVGGVLEEWNLADIDLREAEVRLLSLGAGLRVGRHCGVYLGSELARGYFPSTLTTILPLELAGLWDFNPDSHWYRPIVSAKVRWLQDVSIPGYWHSPGVSAGLGFGYTYELITPRVEVSYLKAFTSFRPQPQIWLFSAGITLGGTYVIGAGRKPGS